MFLTLWYSIRGYVIVEVSGYTLHRLIDLAVRNGITLWDVTYKEGKIYMSTTINGFKRLKPYAQKSRSRFRIVQKKGLPFLLFKYRRRWWFSLGFFGFIMGLYVLCSFVWLVEVEGNKRLETNEIIETLKEAGITTGKFKPKLDLRGAEAQLMKAHKDIMWVGIEAEGTKLHIQITEAEPKPKLHESNEPTHLVAKRDGLIKKVTIRKGMPVVKTGDTVKKGDLLISGELPFSDEQGYLYTASQGDVLAQTSYILKADLPLLQKKKVYEEKSSVAYKIRLFDKKFTLLDTKKTFNQYDTLVTIHQVRLTEKFPLPFYFEKHEKVGYNTITIEADEQNLKDKLLGGLYDKLQELLAKDAKIIRQEISYQKTEQSMTGILRVIAEESIVEVKPIDALQNTSDD